MSFLERNRSQLLVQVKSELNARGFDVLHDFNTNWYNNYFKPSKKLVPLPALSETRGCHALLIGNTKKLWPHFLAFYSKDNSKLPDPLDRFVESSVEQVCRECAVPSFSVFYSHETSPERLVAFQRVANACGEPFSLREDIHMSLHREYGLWFALRALIILTDTPFGPVESPPPPTFEIPLDDTEVARANRLFNKVLVLRANGDDQSITSKRKVWGLLIQVRRSLSLGRGEWEYSPNQLMYHYSKDADYLK